MIAFIKLDNYWASYIPYAFVHMGYYLKKRNIPYKILHNTLMNQFTYDKKRFIKEIERLKPKIIGFSVITGRQTKDSALFSIEIKKRFPHIKIVWGGIHPTILPEQCIKQDYIDFVIQGEADYTMADFYEAFRENSNDYSHIPGVWWKKEGEIFHSDLPPAKVPPEEVGFDFSELDISSYFDHNQGVSILTSRGCPFDCQFCINQTLNNKKWRPLPEDLIKDTITYLKSKQIKHIHINDDNFYLDFNRALSILEYTGLPSFSEVRIPDLLKDRTRLKTLEQLQCLKLMSGGESCDNSILKKIHKNLTYEQMTEAIHLFKKHPKVTPSWSFIIGMPVESVDNIKKTIEGKRKLEEIYGGKIGPTGLYIPFPGSPLYSLACDLGFKQPQTPLDWGVFERYGLTARNRAPNHNAYTWINIKKVWDLLPQAKKKNPIKGIVQMGKSIIYNIIQNIKGFFNGLKEQGEIKKYRKTQINRSKPKYYTPSDLENKRKNYMIEVLSSKLDLKKDIRDALVIGCRNPMELDLLESKGVSSVTGIDLYSYDKRVKVMDMHDIKFNDESFDLIYLSHVLEHAYDYKQVLHEVVRIGRTNAVIFVEVPVNYKTTKVDIQDFKSSERIINMFSEYTRIKDILVQEDLPKGSVNNYSGTDIARVVFSIEK